MSSTPAAMPVRCLLTRQRHLQQDYTMITQEDLYQHLLKEQWKEIIDILYQEKANIKSDTLLSFASKTFETEFLSKVKNYDRSRSDITHYLETLYTLHHGKFYTLSDDNYKFLVLEIVNRKSIFLYL